MTSQHNNHGPAHQRLPGVQDLLQGFPPAGMIAQQPQHHYLHGPTHFSVPNINWPMSDTSYHSSGGSNCQSPMTSSGIHTPTSSRQSSVDIPPRPQRATRSTAAPRASTKRTNASDSPELPYCEVCKSEDCRELAKHGKNLKARKTRKYEQEVTQDAESIILFHTGVVPEKGQNKNNGDSSGLQFDKVINRRMATGLLNHFVGKSYHDARRNGRLAEFQEETASVCKRAAEHGALHGGMYLNLAEVDEERCDHRRGSAHCFVHNSPDWRVCRHNRLAANWQKNHQLQDDKDSQQGRQQVRQQTRQQDARL